MRWWEVIAERQANRRRRALTSAVWELPVRSRRAMLTALESEELIAGAYTDRAGRICPMLAVYRSGARSGVGAFPRAWDDFARVRRPRPATQRELEILRAVLEESLSTPPREHSTPPPAVVRSSVAEA